MTERTNRLNYTTINLLNIIESLDDRDGTNDKLFGYINNHLLDIQYNEYNSNGTNVLLELAYSNQKSALKHIKAHVPGVNFNTRRKQGSSSREVNTPGNSLLMVALYRSHYDLALWLMDAGVNVNLCNKSKMNAVWACVGAKSDPKQAEVLARLDDLGCNFLQANTSGLSVLDFWVLIMSSKKSELLINTKKFDLNAHNKMGKFLLDDLSNYDLKHILDSRSESDRLFKLIETLVYYGFTPGLPIQRANILDKIMAIKKNNLDGLSPKMVSIFEKNVINKSIGVDNSTPSPRLRKI